MYIVVGLGNPGRKYEHTRHNVGFDIVDVLAQRNNITLARLRCKAVVGEGTIAGQRVALALPQTYMNLSGESIRELAEWYKIDSENIIIMYDDISLPVGKLRIREKGSAGGHNGIKNIIYQLKTDVFPRIKIGMGMPQNPEYDIKDYVLGHFSKEETEILIKTVVRAVGAVEEIISSGAKSAMNKFNG